MRFPHLHDPVRNVEEGCFPFQADLRSIRDSAISSFPSVQPLLTPFSALAQASDRGAQSRPVTAVEDEWRRRLRRLPQIQNSPRSLARLTSLATPGATAWITSHAVANAFSFSSEAFRTLLQLFLGLPPHWEGAEIATHMLRCSTGPEVVGIHNLRDALAALMRDAGYRVVVEVSNIMPITTDAQGRHHRGTLDIVGVQPGGGQRALVHFVVTEASIDPASMHIAGHAVGSAEQRKLQHYSGYPQCDQLLPAAVDFGCLGPRFHTLQNLATLGYARRADVFPAEMGLPAAYLSFLQ
eukprot:SM000013S26545  [mRNA]  locus=s13:959072:959990:- [translate_table: standard]